MINPSFAGILDKGDSRYTLVMLVAKRARQIVDGSEILINTKSKKAVTIAIEEIIEGKVTYENPPIISVK